MWSIESLLPVPPGSSGSTRIDSRPGVSPGDLRSIERRGQETLAERVPNSGIRRPSPNESAGKRGRGDRKTPERSQFARVLVVDISTLTTNQGEIGQAERTQFPAGGNETQASVISASSVALH